MDAGADFLGTILSPGFSRSVAPERAAVLRPAGAPAALVGVMVDLPPTRAVLAARAAGVDIVQLHGREGPETARLLRGEGPWRLWKAVRPRSADEVREALDRWAGVVDALLLEGWHEGRGGGVGAAFPLEMVEALRSGFPDGLRFVAAGGLEPGSVAEVVRRLRPHVVDVSSGVESAPGVKDPVKVRAFIRNARAGGGSSA